MNVFQAVGGALGDVHWFVEHNHEVQSLYALPGAKGEEK